MMMMTAQLSARHFRMPNQQPCMRCRLHYDARCACAAAAAAACHFATGGGRQLYTATSDVMCKLSIILHRKSQNIPNDHRPTGPKGDAADRPPAMAAAAAASDARRTAPRRRAAMHTMSTAANGSMSAAAKLIAHPSAPSSFLPSVHPSVGAPPSPSLHRDCRIRMQFTAVTEENREQSSAEYYGVSSLDSRREPAPRVTAVDVDAAPICNTYVSFSGGALSFLSYTTGDLARDECEVEGEREREGGKNEYEDVVLHNVYWRTTRLEMYDQMCS